MILPTVTLEKAAVLPKVVIRFSIDERHSIGTVRTTVLRSRGVFLIARVSPRIRSPSLTNMCRMKAVTCVGRIIGLPRGLLQMLMRKAKETALIGFRRRFPFVEDRVAPISRRRVRVPRPIVRTVREDLGRLFRECYVRGKGIDGRLMTRVLGVSGIRRLIRRVTMGVPLSCRGGRGVLRTLALRRHCRILNTVLKGRVRVVRVNESLRGGIGTEVSGGRERCVLERRLGLVHRRLNRSGATSSTRRFGGGLRRLRTNSRMGRGVDGRVREFGGAGDGMSRGTMLHNCVRAVLTLP